MTNQGMLVCSFNMKKRFSRGEENLYSLNHQYQTDNKENSTTFENAMEMFRHFCLANATLSDDERKKKVFAIKEGTIQESQEATFRAMSFVVKSGSYGIEGDITDKVTQEIKYHRNEEEPDVKEFLCVVYIPLDVGELEIQKGILVFQSIGSYGVKTITTERMRAFFAEIDLTFETRSVSVSAFIEKLILQGSLYKLTLIRNRLSRNGADNMLITTGREEQVYIHPTLLPEWQLKMLTMFRKADETGLIEIPESDDYDDISIQFKLGDKKRTVRLRNLDRLSIIEDIPKEIIQTRNHDRIISYMISTADAYKEYMVWGNRSDI